MYGLILALLAFVLAAPAHAQVHVDIASTFPRHLSWSSCPRCRR